MLFLHSGQCWATRATWTIGTSGGRYPRTKGIKGGFVYSLLRLTKKEIIAIRSKRKRGLCRSHNQEKEITPITRGTRRRKRQVFQLYDENICENQVCQHAFLWFYRKLPFAQSGHWSVQMNSVSTNW